MRTFSKTVRTTQNLHASTQLNKRNGPYQPDKLKKPHSLADEMFQISTQLNKHNELYWKIDQ